MSRYFKNDIKLKELLCLFEHSTLLDDEVCVSSISDNIRTESFSLCEYVKGPLPDAKEGLVLITNSEVDGYNCIVVSNTKLAMYKIIEYIVESDNFAQRYSDSNPVVGQNTKISARAILENDISIGDNCIIEDNVIIYSGTRLGNGCIVRAGAIIGAGHYNHPMIDNELATIPSLGGVCISDNVSIGYNSVVVKGNIDDTKIGYGTKIDALALIGHDCSIGSNVTITVSSSLCGYVRIGDNSRLAPNCTVLQRLIIGENVTVGLGASVITDLDSNNSYFGNPAFKSRKK